MQRMIFHLAVIGLLVAWLTPATAQNLRPCLKPPFPKTAVISDQFHKRADPKKLAAYNATMNAAYSGAVSACTKLLSGAQLSEPERIDVLRTRASWYRGLKMAEEETRDLDALLALYPAEPRDLSQRLELVAILRWRAELAAERKQWALAADHLTHAIGKAGNLPDASLYAAYRDRAAANRALGNLKASIDDLDLAMRSAPAGWCCFVYELGKRAGLLVEAGRYDEAIADYGKILRHSPRSYEHWLQRARVQLQAGHTDAAIADFDTAFSVKADDYGSYRDRAAAYEKQGNYARALADLRIVQTHSPGDEISAEIARVSRLAMLPSRTGTDPEPALTKKAGIAPPPAQRDTVLPQATAERRVALVIGNGAYANAPRLANPGRDAEALATSLKHAGFSSVELARDLRRDQLIDALKIFARKAANADWAVIYFAGHGIEVGGMNYLVPVDARLTSDRDIAFEAIPFEQVLQAIDGAHKLRIAILDACRDNPFLNTMTRAMASRSIGRGLAPIEPPRATLVAYAARHGQVALDGDGGHSPYVTALIKNLETPGLEISLLFRKVRDDVLAATSNEQEPFTYGSLPSEAFYFRKQ